MVLPLHLDADTLPIILARIGTPLKGDAQLNMLADMGARPMDILSNAVVSAAATGGGLSASDATAITNELTKRRHGK